MKKFHSEVLPVPSQHSESRDDSELETWPANHPMQVNGTKKLVQLIAGKMLPISIAGSKKMREFVQTVAPQYTFPSRDRIVEHLIPSQAEVIEKKLKSLIDVAGSICVTVDIWSNRQMRSYFGVTGHLIDEDFNMVAFLLACTRFSGRHTAVNISSNFDQLVAKFEIAGKINFIISDNAANMIKAFDHEEPASGDAVDEECNADNSLEDGMTESTLLEDLPEHERCFAHSLQLVIRHALNKCKSLSDLLKKVNKVVSHIHMSTVATDFLQGEPRPSTANSTRWNSQLKAVQSLMRIDKKKLDSIPSLSPQLLLSVKERQILAEFIELMDPFEEVTNRVQGENVVTAGYVLPSVFQLKSHVSSGTFKFTAELANHLKSELDRLNDFECKLHFQLATFLDPRFKLRFFNEEKKTAVKGTVTGMLNSSSLKDSSLSADVLQPRSKKRKSIFDNLEMETEAASQCNSEVAAYLNDSALPLDSCPLLFWKNNRSRFPQLARLARRYLVIPASSGPVERAFSSAGKIFRPERTRLTDNHFATLMFIKCNMAFLE